MYLNKTFLYGNLTRDPELKATPNGTNVCAFSIATNRTFTKNDVKQEQTEYHNIISFGKVADVMHKHLTKGTPVYVEGRLQTRSWDKDGTKQYRTEVIVDNFQFGPRSESKPASPAEHPLEKEFDKAMQSDKTYKPANFPDGQEYPDGGNINPEDIPF